MADPKRKTETSLRTPKPKKKLGLSVPPPLRMPHDELITARNEAQESDSSPSAVTRLTSQTSLTSQSTVERYLSSGNLQKNRELDLSASAPEGGEPEDSLDGSSMTRQTSLTSMTSLSSHTQTESTKAPIAPTRDFSRVANSISRDVVPAGLFKGKSKQLYDCLYSLTRGAIVPSRTIRISRPKLMTAAGIGSRVTFDSNVAHLILIELVEVRTIPGEHDGNEYTVYLPEEGRSTMPRQTSLSSETSLTGYAHKVDRLVCLESSQTRHSSTPDQSITYGSPNTFLNTHDDDDTHTLLSYFSKTLLDAAQELIGGKLPVTERERVLWNECACVLAEELKKAAENTQKISSIPAFLTAHLRRRFLINQKATSKSKRQDQNSKAIAVESAINNQLAGANPEGEAGETKRGSTYSLEECRRYAQHLQKSGQGINNPGGYATAIYRTGEADALIKKFLSPEAVMNEDKSKCPDCAGLGFIYPEGLEKGVVTKCKHPRLQTTLAMLEHIQQLQRLHAGDATYQMADIIEDLKYRCEQQGVTWDEALAMELLGL